MLSVVLALALSDAGGRCTALRALASPQLEITSARTEGATCRVTGIARPVPGSRVGFEMRLPETGWTGRYVQLGTGGFAGTLFPDTIAAEAGRGNAAAMSDSGHQGDRMSAAWADGNPQAVRDYGYASIAATAEAARRLVRSYYGRPARWRYFVGCSNGGRQALMAAQRYPDDWDGILAGSPANPWSEQLYRLAKLQHALAPLGANSLIARLPQIQQAALTSCPKATVRHGAATAPELCRFDPLLLGLSANEIRAIQLIEAAGYQPTSAAAQEGWGKWILSGRSGQAAFAEQAYRHLFQNNPGWTVARFDPARDYIVASRAAARLDAAPDFSRFARHGGKMLSYMGWGDPLISPTLALSFYRSAARSSGGPRPATDFYRLFMVPGLGHCQGGAGPTSFGQPGTDGNGHPEADIRAALEAWVEHGRAPATIVASDAQGEKQTIPFETRY